MRKQAFIGWLIAAATITQTGCFFSPLAITPIFSSSPDIRARQLIFVSEGYRQSTEIWERIWFLDHPDYMTPYRTHGGVI